MELPEILVSSLGYQQFQERHFKKLPLAIAGAATEYRKLVGWPLLLTIFETNHPNCWLAKQGKLHSDPLLNSGKLNFQSAQMAYQDGYTVLIRKSQLAHPELNRIASEFESFFKSLIDVQIFATPENEQGFDWHYDSEEVFIVQSSGIKEFRLRKNRIKNPASFSELPKNLKLEEHMEGPEIRCTLKAGDFLYIPAGYWHCARALSPSFHLSIGVLLQS